MPAPFPTVQNCVLVPTKRFATLERRGRCVECVWDALTPDWSIAQLKEGHRFSNDDAFCGFFAAEAAPDARRLLDLGSGVGSVGPHNFVEIVARSHINVRRGPVLVARLVSTDDHKKRA